jgi:putative ABC transport system permease protein
MWGLTLADLRYRYRQFLIAVVGAGVVLAMALLLAGLAAGFSVEIHRTVGAVGAQRWVLSANSAGRIAAVGLFPESDATVISNTPGVTRADPLVIVPQQVAHVGSASKTVNVFGATIGGMGDPAIASGSALSGPGQVVASSTAGARTGSDIEIGAMRFRVVGQVRNRTILGGGPVLYMSLGDAQALAFGGRPEVTAVVTRGVPAQLPAGLAMFSTPEVEHNALAALAGGVKSIDNSRVLMWLVAAIIIAALLYVSALQRTRDFAVLKALGSSSMDLFASLALQSVIVAAVAAVFAMVICNFMTGIFAQPVAIPDSAFATMPLVAVVVGLISSLFALRRVTRADPAAAFGG